MTTAALQSPALNYQLALSLKTGEMGQSSPSRPFINFTLKLPLSEVDRVMKQTHFSVRCITSAWGMAKTTLACSNPCLSLTQRKCIRISKPECQAPVYLKTTHMTLRCSGFEITAQDKNAQCLRDAFSTY